MRVLAVDDAHPAGPGDIQYAPDRREGRLRVRHQEFAATLDEVILHVDHDQRGLRRIDADLVLDGVRGKLDVMHGTQAAIAR